MAGQGAGPVFNFSPGSIVIRGGSFQIGTVHQATAAAAARAVTAGPQHRDGSSRKRAIELTMTSSDGPEPSADSRTQREQQPSARARSYSQVLQGVQPPAQRSPPQQEPSAHASPSHQAVQRDEHSPERPRPQQEEQPSAHASPSHQAVQRGEQPSRPRPKARPLVKGPPQGASSSTASNDRSPQGHQSGIEQAMRQFAAWEMGRAVDADNEEAPSGGRKHRTYKGMTVELTWEVYANQWDKILRQLVSAGVLISGWREREVTPEELPPSYQDRGDLLCWRWSKNHAEKYSREHGLDLDIQKQYARVSALVQMITIAKELEGITPLESAQIKKKWTNKLKGKLGNSTRQTAFGKWLGRRSGAAEKNVVGETWVLAKITEHDLQYFQRQLDHVACHPGFKRR